MRLTWLMLSELPATLEKWRLLLDILETDLRSLTTKTGQIDFIFLWGSHTKVGSPEEFSFATEKISALLERIDFNGTKPRLYLLPGSSDVRRADPLLPSTLVFERWQTFPEVQQDFWTSPTSSYRRFLIEHYANFTTWSSGHAHPDTTQGILPGDFCTTLTKEDFAVGLLGLNDASLSFLRSESPVTLHPAQGHALCHPDIPRWHDSHNCSLLFTTRSPSTYPESSKHIFFGEIAPPTRFALRISAGEILAYTSQSIGGAGRVRDLSIPPLGQGYCVGNLSAEDDSISVRLWPRRLTRRPGGQQCYIPDQNIELQDDGGTASELLTTQQQLPRAGGRPRPASETSNIFAVGPHLLARGRQVAMQGASWKILVEEFILGGTDELVHFCEKWQHLPPHLRCIAFHGRNDARMITAAPTWENNNGFTTLSIDVSGRAMTRDASGDVDMDLDFGFGDDGDISLVKGSAVLRKQIQRFFETPLGGFVVVPELGSWWETYEEALVNYGLPRTTALKISIELEALRLMRAPEADTGGSATEAYVAGVDRLLGARLSAESVASPIVNISLDVLLHSAHEPEQWGLCFIRPSFWRKWGADKTLVAKCLLVRSVGKLFERLDVLKGTPSYQRSGRSGRRLIAALNGMAENALAMFPEAELSSFPLGGDTSIEEVEERLRMLYIILMAEIRLEVGEVAFGNSGLLI